jgi:hypothetical protein
MAVVIAIHEIEDVEGFWAAVHSSATHGPTARLDALYPLVNGSKAVSVWDGLSADVVGDFLDARVGHFGSSELYEVDRNRAAQLTRSERQIQGEDR